MHSLSRRVALKILGVGSALVGTGRAAVASPVAAPAGPPPVLDRWRTTHDRVWLGERFWANPMEDWRIVRGAAECQSLAGDRSIHLLTHQFADAAQPMAMEVSIELAEQGNRGGGAGFRLGVRSEINEHRANCFAKGGLTAGIVGDQLVLGRASTKIPPLVSGREIRLTLIGQPRGGQYHLALSARPVDSETALASVETAVPGETLLGNVALVNNYDAALKARQGGRCRFRDWSVEGPAFAVHEDRQFGPLLWTMYSLSDSRSDEGFVLKLSALTGPLGADDDHAVELQLQRDGQWQSIGRAELDSDAWVATFRVPRWDATRATPYRVVYRERQVGGPPRECDWTGVIQANPVNRPLRLGALTCQNDYAFPYEPVVNNLAKLDPDLLFFSGDQLYENHGGYGIIRDPAEPAILNYLRKFYQFGWAFRAVLRDRPTLCIPDDHDVFQGNIWGEGGVKMAAGDAGASSKGGYREPARMVNVVHRTCVGHHPDYFDPTPCEQNISVYYGDMVYGSVGFAILGDRQWKSGPERVQTGSGRADHVEDPNFDCSTLDQPGLVLLGERQEAFLRHWARDWRGHAMKVLLSQTVFAGLATHHGSFDGYLKADLDSGGWPQTARNRAIDILRESMALHICGDQHLATLSQYGVARQRDSNWAFCTPAIAVGYPRWWRPDELGLPHANRPPHGLANTGEYLDGLGNKVFVYAVGNPAVGTAKHRYERAEEKGSGFALVTIDTQAKTYFLEAFRFLVDAVEGNAAQQFPGWPVLLHQSENRGENHLR